MTAPIITVKDVHFYERTTSLRMPFKFGAIALTEAPQVFAQVRLSVGGSGESLGCAAELMVPKWFDKNPALSNEENWDQLRRALLNARSAYMAAGGHTAFGLFANQYKAILAEGKRNGLNRLTAGYGPALLDRAIADALCRHYNVSFWDGVRANLMGLTDTELTPDLANVDLGSFVSTLAPSESLNVRHTVGMADPLTSADKKAGERIGDGLPETLEEVIDTYGCSYFKIKVRGDVSADLDRLSAIASVLGDIRERYWISLDCNEQFDDLEGVVELWDAMKATPALSRFVGSVMFIEQPISREKAMDVDVTALPLDRPLIIDESDDHLDAFGKARSKGYVGVTSKSCKGIYKSMINAARCHAWNLEEGNGSYFMTGEDLSCQAGISVQQDLALVSLLGLKHVERNGHHYVRGMSAAPGKEQNSFVAAHPDLYQMNDDVACLRIENGQVSIGSLGTVGFACGVEPEWDHLNDMKAPAGAL